jgi:hypothetical protein
MDFFPSRITRSRGLKRTGYRIRNTGRYFTKTKKAGAGSQQAKFKTGPRMLPGRAQFHHRPPQVGAGPHELQSWGVLHGRPVCTLPITSVLQFPFTFGHGILLPVPCHRQQMRNFQISHVTQMETMHSVFTKEDNIFYLVGATFFAFQKFRIRNPHLNPQTYLIRIQSRSGSQKHFVEVTLFKEGVSIAIVQLSTQQRIKRPYEKRGPSHYELRYREVM